MIKRPNINGIRKKARFRVGTPSAITEELCDYIEELEKENTKLENELVAVQEDFGQYVKDNDRDTS